MADHDRGPGDRDDGSLRERAREALRRHATSSTTDEAPDLETLVDELRLHQVELELQNEDLRRAQRALERSRDRYASLFDDAPVGYLQLDDAGVILELNLTAASMLGGHRERLVGRSLRSFVDQDNHAVLREHLARRRLQVGHTVHELTMNSSRCQVTDVQLDSVAVDVDPDGPVQYRSALVDIGARVRIERELRLHHQQLRDLGATAARVEDAERRRIAAELHGQLGQRLAACALMLKAHQLRRPEPAADLDRPLDLLGEIIGDLRKLSSRLYSPILSDIGLGPALEELARDVSRDHDLALSVDLPVEDPVMDEDLASLLYTVVVELLHNVIKHADATTARVTMRVIGDAVAVTVEDDGVGIDAALKAAPQDEPAGFGLDLLRERLDYLGGQLQVSSDADHGTRVSLTLPLRHCSTPTPAR